MQRVLRALSAVGLGMNINVLKTNRMIGDTDMFLNESPDFGPKGPAGHVHSTSILLLYLYLSHPSHTPRTR